MKFVLSSNLLYYLFVALSRAPKLSEVVVVVSSERRRRFGCKQPEINLHKILDHGLRQVGIIYWIVGLSNLLTLTLTLAYYW